MPLYTLENDTQKKIVTRIKTFCDKYNNKEIILDSSKYPFLVNCNADVKKGSFFVNIGSPSYGYLTLEGRINEKSYGIIELGSRGLNWNKIQELFSEHIKIPSEIHSTLCIADGGLVYCPSRDVKSVRIGKEEEL